jgi:hypothetical protein
MSLELHINAGRQTTYQDEEQALIDQIVVGNVIGFEVDDDFGPYEGNIDGEFTVELKDGSTVTVEGYHGMWEIICFDRLAPQYQDELINNFRDWAADMLTNTKQALQQMQEEEDEE